MQGYFLLYFFKDIRKVLLKIDDMAIRHILCSSKRNGENKSINVIILAYNCLFLKFYIESFLIEYTFKNYSPYDRFMYLCPISHYKGCL